MAGYALADVLADFAQHPRLSSAQRRPLTESGPASRDEAPIDIEALLADERTRVERETRQKLTTEHEAALVTERERHAEEIAALSRRYGEDAGELLSAGLREIEAGVVKTVSGVVARMLVPIVSEEILKRSIDDLAKAIGEALDDVDAITIGVSGPLSLYSALTEKMGERAKYLRHREADGVDLVAEVNGSLLETRLADWQAVVNEALA